MKMLLQEHENDGTARVKAHRQVAVVVLWPEESGHLAEIGLWLT